MALKKYNVTVNGFETVLQLDERGAKARGLTDRDLFKPASKQADKTADKPAAAPAGKQAAAPANKSRTADNK